MSSPMTDEEYACYEALARSCCEWRAEYRQCRQAGTLDPSLDDRMLQALREMNDHHERMKSLNELE